MRTSSSCSTRRPRAPRRSGGSPSLPHQRSSTQARPALRSRRGRADTRGWMRRARTQPDTTEGLPGTIATEARIVGLRDFSTPIARGGRASPDPAVDPDLDHAGLGQRRRRGPVDLADVPRLGDLVRPPALGHRPDVDRVLRVRARQGTPPPEAIEAPDRRTRPHRRPVEPPARALAAAASRQGDERGPRARRRAGRDPAQRTGAAGRGERLDHARGR